MNSGNLSSRGHGLSVSRKSAPGQPWSDAETAHLIGAYEEKWYSLKRGQLKAHQWDDVATSLSARCGYGYPPRTGTQCRHKMEKLRKRYRTEQRAGGPSRWIHFDQMDRMECGPFPVATRAPLLPTRPHVKGGAFVYADGEDGGHSDESEDDEEEEEEEEDEEEEEEKQMNGNKRSINGGLREEDWGFPCAPRKYRYREKEAVEDKGGAVGEVAMMMKSFEEAFVRMEKRRMELMREMERDWMEMEEKRMEMIVESERYLVDAISRAFHSAKKAKKSAEE